jgi:signal transduction histidine kinase
MEREEIVRLNGPIPIAVLSGSMLVHLLYLLRFVVQGDGTNLVERVTFLVVLCVSALVSVAKHFTSIRPYYLIAVGVHLALSIPVVALLESYGYASLVWAVVFVAEIVFYVSARLSVALGGAFCAVYAVVIGISGVSLWDVATDMVCLAGVVAGGALLGQYRQELVTLEGELARLDGAVTQLGRANMSYQEYAIDVEERSTEEERKRITRDIHDVVGYTLTNNIIMMEAAVDMIRKDPLGVPALLQSARDNAEEGLEQIRTALYQFRERTVDHPEGVAAIARMVRIFRQTTGVEVKLEIGGIAPLALGPGSRETVQHFVQESLINSFRHGRATQILVMLYWGEGEFSAAVWDNGSGMSSNTEGIGISGMRERAAKLGGRLSYENVVDGFSIKLRIARDRLR